MRRAVGSALVAARAAKRAAKAAAKAAKAKDNHTRRERHGATLAILPSETILPNGLSAIDDGEMVVDEDENVYYHADMNAEDGEEEGEEEADVHADFSWLWRGTPPQSPFGEGDDPGGAGAGAGVGVGA